MSRRTQGDRDHRQRLLDRFIKTGLAGFADYEILEFLAHAHRRIEIRSF